MNLERMESREARLKQRLNDLCDRMFSKKRAQTAKDDVLYWILKHPRLYVAGDTCEFYLVTDCGNRLPQANFMSYISYATSEDLDTLDEDFEAITRELETLKNIHFNHVL